MARGDSPLDEAMPAKLRDAQLRARRVPGWLRLVLGLVAAATAITFIATVSGPYRWFAVAEARCFGGEYWPTLTGALTFVVCLVPVGVIIHAIAKRLPPTAEEQARPPRAQAKPR